MAIEKISWGGWNNCYRIHNEVLELIVTADVGPRILHLSFIGEGNVLHVEQDQLATTGGDHWRLYGGHRLWHAPEDRVRTYQPDNQPVTVDLTEGRFTTPIEAQTGIEKSVQITLDEDTVTLRHAMTNHNQWEIELALWSLTVMAQGGQAILPLPKRGSHKTDLLPNTRLTVWPYTDLSDERLSFHPRFVGIQQNPAIEPPIKLGIFTPAREQLAYINGETAFVKQIEVDASGEYPDMGSAAEVFCNNIIIELETLSPLTRIAPGATAYHIETWRLLRDVALPVTDATLQQLGLD